MSRFSHHSPAVIAMASVGFLRSSILQDNSWCRGPGPWGAAFGGGAVFVATFLEASIIVCNRHREVSIVPRLTS